MPVSEKKKKSEWRINRKAVQTPVIWSWRKNWSVASEGKIPDRNDLSSSIDSESLAEIHDPLPEKIFKFQDDDQ